MTAGASSRRRDTQKDTPVVFKVIPVWKQVTPELKAELVDFWKNNKAIGDPARAAARTEQAICIGRDADGAICAVGTALIRVLPRLLQPMYYYRLFFAKSVRGQKQMPAFFNRCREVLQTYNASLPTPESLGVLIELESGFLSTFYKQAHVAEMNSTFIGYSPRGLQLRVSYFDGATLLPPVTPAGLPLTRVNRP
ncbi:hypothetical protein GCM10008098_06450 [Rhodanobacter panaciterrae]|jgi:hypothetical protein|uniref:Uncharacterized protein n=1 Tax=Rhodanobacter panaciterrae TaxID=490572 RepID=A0ABQ2ZM81_9GAMM|nr:hypothetical protein GCM10008098_06450 [Rhodanobacter panaciterrae]